MSHWKHTEGQLGQIAQVGLQKTKACWPAENQEATTNKLSKQLNC